MSHDLTNVRRPVIMDDMKTYRVPAKFYWDHTYRDLPEAGVSKLLTETKTHVTISLDAVAYNDLRSDAAYYSDAGVARDMGMRGLAASAKATVRALDAQGTPPAELRYMTEAEDRAVYGSVENLS